MYFGAIFLQNSGLPDAGMSQPNNKTVKQAKWQISQHRRSSKHPQPELTPLAAGNAGILQCQQRNLGTPIEI
jgi:hypothetical protein